jgi:ribosome-binding factor A
MRAALTDRPVERCFGGAVENLLCINTVPCDHTVYNSTGLLTHDRMFRAGGDYDTPWTRDAAINTWNAGRFLAPEVARDTLLAVCTPDEKGLAIIQPDNQKWDRVVWIIGAWQYWLATGDGEFLELARGITDRSLAQLRVERFDEGFGLYRGGSFFNDGIAGYPKDLYEPGMDSSFVGDHPKCDEIFCLSTNILYCEALRIADRMGLENDWRGFRENVRTRFQNSDGSLRYLLYPDGRWDDSKELAGYAFGVLFDVFPGAVLEHLDREKFGIPSIMPPFPGLFSEERPGRHNNLIWPFLNGFYIRAAAKCGMAEEVRRELDAIIREELNDPRIDGTWSITRAEVTGDLRFAKIHVSVLEEEKREPLLAALKNAKGYLRRALGRKMIIRTAPELIFVDDRNIEYGVHIASVLAKAGISGQETEPEEDDEES